MNFKEKRTYTIRIYTKDSTTLKSEDVLIPMINENLSAEEKLKVWRDYLEKFSDEEKFTFIKADGTMVVIMKSSIISLSFEEYGVNTNKKRGKKI